MQTVLVVDDDRTVFRLVAKALQDSNVNLLTATNAVEGLAAIEQHRPDVLLLDVQLPDMSGLEIAEQVRALDPKMPVAYMTVSESSDVAIQAMKCGGYDFLLKPLDVEQVHSVIERALETRRMMDVPVKLPASDGRSSENGDHDALIGRSPQMLEVYKEIGRVAAQDVTVYIFGESGTGKELVARAIYQHSLRNGQPFLVVNCAALSETLLESELFGHEKGAFTGADRTRIGKFEQAHNGTLFLDEVGDMSPSVQSKVLRLLQEQNFERLGGTQRIQTNVRIIAATNRELEKMVHAGEFRLDLFHRLNDYRIELPPLRERGDDIVLLVEHFLAGFKKTMGKCLKDVSPEALKLLREYGWPGNARELQTVLKKAVLKATGPVLTPEFLPSIVRSSTAINTESPSTEDRFAIHDLRQFIDERQQDGSTSLYLETLEMMERYLLTRVLRDNDGNQSKTAQQLGITRGSLRRKIRTLNISIGSTVEIADT